MVWVLSFFCNGLCESKLWTQQFYRNTSSIHSGETIVSPIFFARRTVHREGELSLRRPWPPCRQRGRESKR